jgi:hypothetical protein
MSQNIYHTTKTVIKRQTSQKVNVIKRQMVQNITSKNENCHKTTKIVLPNLTYPGYGQSHQTEFHQTMNLWAVCPNLT